MLAGRCTRHQRPQPVFREYSSEALLCVLVLSFEAGLPAGGTLADVFGETGDGQIAQRFMLNAIDPRRHLLAIEVSRLGWRAFMRERYLNPVGEAREGYIQARMVFPEGGEQLAAGGDDRRLQLSDGVILHARRVCQITRRASHGRRQPGISINL